jgi:hypothetical protein
MLAHKCLLNPFQVEERLSTVIFAVTRKNKSEEGTLVCFVDQSHFKVSKGKSWMYGCSEGIQDPTHILINTVFCNYDKITYKIL